MFVNISFRLFLTQILLVRSIFIIRVIFTLLLVLFNWFFSPTPRSFTVLIPGDRVSLWKYCTVCTDVKYTIFSFYSQFVRLFYFSTVLRLDEIDAFNFKFVYSTSIEIFEADSGILENSIQVFAYHMYSSSCSSSMWHF